MKEKHQYSGYIYQIWNCWEHDPEIRSRAMKQYNKDPTTEYEEEFKDEKIR